MSMETINYQAMHCDHQHWISENAMWRNDLSCWQEECRGALNDLAAIQTALGVHQQVMQTHAASIRAREQDLADTEVALAQALWGRTNENLERITLAHQEEAARRMEQRDEHERLKRHHHRLAALVRGLRKAIAEGT